MKKKKETKSNVDKKKKANEKKGKKIPGKTSETKTLMQGVNTHSDNAA